MFYCLACRIDYLLGFTGQSEKKNHCLNSLAWAESDPHFILFLGFFCCFFPGVRNKLCADWHDLFPTLWNEQKLEGRASGSTIGVTVSHVNTGSFCAAGQWWNNNSQKEKLPNYWSACFTSLIISQGPVGGWHPEGRPRDESPLQPKSIFWSMTHFSCPLTGIRRIAHTNTHTARNRPSLRCVQVQRFHLFRDKDHVDAS